MQTQQSKGSVGGAVVFIVLLFIVIGAIMNCANSGPDRAGIEDAVQTVISRGLLNPDGATFSDDSNTTINDEGNDKYEVEGYIDDTNAFGAKIRNNYKAEAIKQDDGSYNVTYQLQNAVTGQWN